MRLCQIIEAEVDPKTGEVHRWVDRDKLLRKYAGDKSVFVHFSDVNKLGLNPSSKFDTPIGIYGYPVDYVIKSFGSVSLFDLPFAGDRKYAVVFRVKDLDKCWIIKSGIPELPRIQSLVSKWSHKVYNMTRGAGYAVGDENWYKQYLRHIHLACSALIGPDLNWKGQELDLPGFPEINKLAETFELSNSQLNAVKFLTVAHDFMHRGWKANSPDDLLWRLYRTVGKFVSRNTAFGWSKVLMGLGYSGVIDNGNGVIHPSEPTQAVFFRLSNLEHLETIRNSLGVGDTAPVLPKPYPTVVTRRSLIARDVKSGGIPDRVMMMLRWPPGHQASQVVFSRTSDHLMHLIDRCRDLASDFDETKGFKNDIKIKLYVGEFREYRESLLIFKHNSPEKYSGIRPELLENFKNYKKAFENYNIGRHEKMMPIVTAFDKLMRAI